jgi:hypothetical protein
MDCFIISYDLKEGDDYGPLIDAIKAYGTWAHITESTWGVVTDKSAGEVRDDLEQHVPEGGRLFVVKSAQTGAWRNVICRNEWLKEHL